MPQNIFKEEESESLDYKLEYHKNNARLLHDILCLSNADSKSARRLLFGVSDNRQKFPGVTKDPNRKTQASIIDWLRKIKLNYIPSIKLESIFIEGLEFDILTIENYPKKPYFLTEYYRDGDTTLPQGAVYTRDKRCEYPHKLLCS